GPEKHKFSKCPNFGIIGENLDLAMSKDEVVALIGDGECAVKTLTRNHLYCEPPTALRESKGDHEAEKCLGEVPDPPGHQMKPEGRG
uniref:Uncharacterized protein n=1 Tax=Sinocyclocheilus rhinocerous TaxID=307959 RepID=A0A673GV17_9TELE